MKMTVSVRKLKNNVDVPDSSRVNQPSGCHDTQRWGWYSLAIACDSASLQLVSEFVAFRFFHADSMSQRHHYGIFIPRHFRMRQTAYPAV